MQFIAEEFLGQDLSSNLQEYSFFASPVCHEAGIWNIDTSVSTCIEVVLSEVELRNRKVLKVTIFILNSAQIQALRNAC